ncbi:hypothetical protein OROHE_010679 [Orobanche hederae]
MNCLEETSLQEGLAPDSWTRLISFGDISHVRESGFVVVFLLFVEEEATELFCFDSQQRLEKRDRAVDFTPSFRENEWNPSLFKGLSVLPN